MTYKFKNGMNLTQRIYDGWKERRSYRRKSLLAGLSTDPHPFESMVIIKRIEAAMAREVELESLMAVSDLIEPDSRLEAPVAILAPRPVVTREMTAREFVLACEAA